jgi:4-hydroxy-3-methylbut-2-enyl diphosphate reductase
MKVQALIPRGYCHGVVHAINTLKKLVKDPTIKRPIYVLGMVVHNTKITQDFSELGIITLHDPKKTRLELLDLVSEGTIVFTAHGVSDAVYQKATTKNLDIIDTTCKDVKRSQNIVKSYLASGYHVLFIGKKHHPEVETVLSYSDRVHLITNENDIAALTIEQNEKLALTNQTTMSLFDVYTISEALKKRYPNLEIIEEVCNATKTRQLAVMHQDKAIDHCFVVGDTHSNNASKLVEVSKKHGVKASLIRSIEDIDHNQLKDYQYVSVTAAASAPSQITKEVIDFLKAYNPSNPKNPTKSRVLTNNLFSE